MDEQQKSRQRAGRIAAYLAGLLTGFFVGAILTEISHG